MFAHKSSMGRISGTFGGFLSLETNGFSNFLNFSKQTAN